jgi:hypothetical protein
MDDLSSRGHKSNNSSSSNKLNVTNYYESLRCNVMSLLGCSQPVPTGSSGLPMPPTSSNFLMTSPEQQDHHQQHFDSYLSKLQTMCSPMMEESSHSHLDSNKGGVIAPSPVAYDSVKSSLYNLSCPLSSRT